MGWKALLDLEPGELVCVQWLLQRIERRDHAGPRALAREGGISSNTATAFLHSPWVAWAEAVLRSNNGMIEPEVAPMLDLQPLRQKLRITSDNANGQVQPFEEVGA